MPRSDDSAISGANIALFLISSIICVSALIKLDISSHLTQLVLAGSGAGIAVPLVSVMAGIIREKLLDRAERNAVAPIDADESESEEEELIQNVLQARAAVQELEAKEEVRIDVSEESELSELSQTHLRVVDETAAAAAPARTIEDFISEDEVIEIDQATESDSEQPSTPKTPPSSNVSHAGSETLLPGQVNVTRS